MECHLELYLLCLTEDDRVYKDVLLDGVIDNDDINAVLEMVKSHFNIYESIVEDEKNEKID
jgi:hypothetical protein